jgi:hypothetical protein
MEHRDIKYTVVQGIERRVWKWSAFAASARIFGQESSRSAAVAAAESAIDRALADRRKAIFEKPVDGKRVHRGDPSAEEPSTKKRHNWNDLEIVANCKDTPIRRCGGNQRGNWRNERRPCVAMTGPTRAGDKSTYGVYFNGEPDSLASMDWSRRTFSAVRHMTIRWKLDLILLNPPNHTSSIPAAGVNFATSF